MKRASILILSASGGAGHIRAAEALHRTARQSNLPVTTEHFDCLDFTSRSFKRLYAETYLNLVNRTPELWGYLYQKAESKPYRKKGLLELFDHFNYKRYLRFLSRSRADAIVCTHFLPYISVSNELRREGIETPIFAATTDFDVHQYWVDPIVYRYYVFHEESSWQLQSKGIPSEKIFVKGIPIMPEFLENQGRRSARKELGLAPSSFTVLVLSGGFGVGRVEDIVKSAAQTLGSFPQRQFNLVAICGKNEPVKNRIQRLEFPRNVKTSIHGFVQNIQVFMSAADVLITKSGGLTSSEALARKLPMIIVDPIPGQETRNADLIIEHGAGWKAIDLANLRFKLSNVLRDTSVLQAAHRAAGKIARPNAARLILDDICCHLHLVEGKSK